MNCVTKDILYPGSYRLPDGRTFTCEPKDIPHYAQRMKDMLAAGLHIPAAWEHQDKAKPSTADEYAALRAEKTKLTLGHATDAMVTADGILETKFEVPDAGDRAALPKVRFVSPEIVWDYVDSTGRKWDGPSITHLAVTPRPVQHAQKPFRMSATERMAPMRLSMTEYEPIRMSEFPPEPIKLGADASGHEHDQRGQFAAHAQAAHAASKKTVTKGLNAPPHHKASETALKATKSGDHRAAADAHRDASRQHQQAAERWKSSSAEAASALHKHHSEAAAHHQKAAIAHHAESAEGKADKAHGRWFLESGKAARLSEESDDKPAKDGDKPADDGDEPPAPPSDSVEDTDLTDKPAEPAESVAGDDVNSEDTAVKVQAIVAKLAEIDLALGDDVPDDFSQFLDRLNVAISTKLAVENPGSAAAGNSVTESTEDLPMEAQPPVLMSMQKRIDSLSALVVKTGRENLKGRISALWANRQVTKAMADKMLAEVSTVKLSLDDNGELAHNKLVARVEAYEELPKDRAKFNATEDDVRLSEVDPPSNLTDKADIKAQEDAGDELAALAGAPRKSKK